VPADDETRERVMRRLAEILQGPPPSSSGRGPVTAGSLEDAVAALGLDLSPADTEQVTGAIRQAPDPEKVAELLQTLVEGFQSWQRKEKKQGEEG
jgi:hypothetical protein